MIEDVPGVGKTVLAKSLARAAGCDFSRLQCTADLLPADVTGVTVWDQNAARVRLPARPGLRQPGAGRRDQPRLAEDPVGAPRVHGGGAGDGRRRDPPAAAPFMIIATQNPVEYEGTFPLPEAQLDRFAVRVHDRLPAGRRTRPQMLLDLAAARPARAVAPVTDEAGVLARPRRGRARPRRPGPGPLRRGRSSPPPAATRRVQLGAQPARRPGAAARGQGAGPARAAAATRCPRTSARWPAPSLSHRLILTPDARARGARPGSSWATRSTRCPSRCEPSGCGPVAARAARRSSRPARRRSSPAGASGRPPSRSSASG